MKTVASKALLILTVLVISGCYGRFKDYQDPEFTVTPDGEVIVPECTVYSVSSEEPSMLGCYTESSRWQMAVHPEKMVPVKPLTKKPKQQQPEMQP